MISSRNEPSENREGEIAAQAWILSVLLPLSIKEPVWTRGGASAPSTLTFHLGFETTLNLLSQPAQVRGDYSWGMCVMPLGQTVVTSFDHCNIIIHYYGLHSKAGSCLP